MKKSFEDAWLELIRLNGDIITESETQTGDGGAGEGEDDQGD